MMVLAFIRPETLRNVLLVLIGGGYLVYHLIPLARRCAGIVRRRAVTAAGKSDEKEESASALSNDGGANGENIPKSDQSAEDESVSATTAAKACDSFQPSTATDSQQPVETPFASGEELFRQARGIPHQEVPDFELDGEYLGLLGKSAAVGHAPALAKLGEYAMRRAAWVESYYWMTLARRNGMLGLEPVLQEILQNWVEDGFPDEVENENALFSAEAGSLGRALVHLNAGQDAAAAGDFLEAHYPDFLQEIRQ